MDTLLDVFVEGLPKGQPRARARRMGNHISMYDPGTADDWIAAIRESVAAAFTLKEPVGSLSVTAHFIFPRPRSHYRSGRNAHLLKDSAPVLHTNKPDLDNAIKLVCDALGTPKRPLVYKDDACIVSIVSSKRWAKDGEAFGMRLLVNEMRDQAAVQLPDPS